MTIGALIVARNTPAVAYEPSIYAATPPIVWIVLFINLICGTGIIVSHIYTEKYIHSNSWLLGLGLIFLSYTIVLSLWIIRGYALWCVGDPAVHLGLIQDIVSSGHIGQTNIYPLIHIYAAEYSIICGVLPTVFQRLIPLIFALLYVPFTYLLAKSVLPQKGQVILALLASMTLGPITLLNFTPNFEANYVFPLAIFLLIKSFDPGTVQWRILFIIMIFIFPVFHPVPSLALCVTLLTLWLANKILHAVKGKYLTVRIIYFKFDIIVLLLLLIWAITWYSNFGAWSYTIRKLWNVMMEGGGLIEGVVATIRYAEGYGYSVTQYLFRMHGGVLIDVIITLLTIPILIRKLRFQPDLSKLMYLYCPVIVIGLLTIMLYFLNIDFGPDRLLVYIVMLCTPFIAFGLYELLTQTRHSRLVPFITVIILVALTVNATAAIYTSPYIYMDNWQITRTEITGMDWFLHKMNTNIGITGIKVMPRQFASFLLAEKELPLWPDIITPKVPYHFGYNNYATLGQVFAQNTYMVLMSRDKSIYRDIYPAMAGIRFLPQDFEKVNYDITVNRLYSNSGFEVYFINSLK